MKSINDENIDEIMFQLLEGEITGAERVQLLEAIEADASYSKLWQTWQQTILSPENEPIMDTRQLKKRSARIIPFNYKYAIAAMLVLGLGLAIFLTNRGTIKPDIAGPKPSNPKSRTLPEAPQPEITKPYETKEDSVVPLKEKIRTMAGQDKVRDKKTEPVLQGDKSHFDVFFPPQKNDRIVDAPDGKTKLPEKMPEQTEEPTDHIIVVASTDSKPAITQPVRRNLLSRILGQPRLKLENDSTTRTNKKLIIENKQYRIIAGF